MISAAKRTALRAASFLSAMTLVGTASFAIDGGSVAGRNRLSQATVVADGPGGPVLWGVASAVLTSRPPCGNILVIAPAAPNI
jgi:hypothetical protein